MNWNRRNLQEDEKKEKACKLIFRLESKRRTLQPKRDFSINKRQFYYIEINFPIFQLMHSTMVVPLYRDREERRKELVKNEGRKLIWWRIFLNFIEMVWVRISLETDPLMISNVKNDIIIYKPTWKEDCPHQKKNALKKFLFILIVEQINESS